MKPKLIYISEKRIIGMKSSMYHNEYGNIIKLWKRFMPSKNKIENILNKDFIALQTYSDFNDFEKPFDIWACVGVSNLETIPKEMKGFTIPEGEYAVFLHKGMDTLKAYQQIMTEWLPNSGFKVDDRPHFQVMGEKYKNGSPDSEEDFYIPITPKN
ncbi:GyrI-like domain-containing protein [Winogradskyella sp. UBA3174]|uniref:GyrI-like domain-containing protein n=1 Tax=Winogradskyella sp. UBA3174 TaxID=1947785 RepID=UPI0025F43D8E|nr:GyrI-like domain-containing protein [Winogradskyella sp. UBA3174]|tara:strand:+ start:11651 stop:12118 length:468 start_codon:yes stop_codon:yes gene_type:complete